MPWNTDDKNDGGKDDKNNAGNEAALRERLEAVERERDELLRRHEAGMVKRAFADSAFVSETFVSPDLAFDLFGSRFAVKNGAVVAKDNTGQTLTGENSQTLPFEDALALLAKERPYIPLLAKPSAGAGSGAGTPGAGGDGDVNPQAEAKRYRDLKTAREKAAYLKAHIK